MMGTEERMVDGAQPDGSGFLSAQDGQDNPMVCRRRA